MKSGPRTRLFLDNALVRAWVLGEVGGVGFRPCEKSRPPIVCETWRPIFPSRRGLASGIINPCATAADRRAGAGTLRTGYRGWSDSISAPSGTDALNHTNSKYERMCTEEQLDKVCPSGRPHHFLTKKLFKSNGSDQREAGRTDASRLILADGSHPSLWTESSILAQDERWRRA